MQRECDGCGAAYEAKSSLSRFCRSTECDRARARGRKARERGTVVQLPARVEVEDDSNEAVTRRELEAAGRLGSVAGRNALSLARRLDLATQDSGSSFAALAKQHLAAVEKALEGVAAAGDGLDELAERRRRRA